MRDDLTELRAMLAGDGFAFSPSRLAVASATLQEMASAEDELAAAIGSDVAEDLHLAVAALEALYVHLNRMVRP